MDGKQTEKPEKKRPSRNHNDTNTTDFSSVSENEVGNLSSVDVFQRKTNIDHSKQILAIEIPF